jgi:hypothetical protein
MTTRSIAIPIERNLYFLRSKGRSVATEEIVFLSRVDNAVARNFRNTVIIRNGRNHVLHKDTPLYEEEKSE